MSKLRIFVAFRQTFCIRSMYETILNDVRRQKWIGFRNPIPSQTTEGKKWLTIVLFNVMYIHDCAFPIKYTSLCTYHGNIGCQASKKELKIHRFLGTYVFWRTQKPHVFWWTQKIMKGPLKDMRFWVHQKTWGFRRGKKGETWVFWVHQKT